MMKIQQDNSRILLWLGSALFASCVHLYLLWWLSTPAVAVTSPFQYPMAVMLGLSAEPEFTPNVEQNPVVGMTQNLSEPIVEPAESQPEQVSELLTAPEQSNASLVVEKEREVVKKEPVKAKWPQPEVSKPRKPVIEETAVNRSKPSPPAATTSTTLSGESKQIAAATNSDSLHVQQIKMNWRSHLQGHLMGFKRYPPIARKQRQQGTAMIRFVVNREGYVLSSQLIKSSGVAILDREALALIKRAQPLPKPPTELLSHGQITLELPIGFDLKNKKR
ncbi:energy transducer TonB family protein [Yersinia bercovieri]|uniref:energy transducer TonB family protein n=1 Tax=Yersinia bercovieri TaxID=634 RepID=UPI0016439D6F|nr:energy transducer TonB [Yersinia bercovieri]